MNRRSLKKWVPTPEQIRRYRVLQRLGAPLFAPSLWRFARDPIARATAIGLFWAVAPIPLQMVPASLFAIRLRANLPLSVGLVLLTNPLTAAPVYYANWRLGCFLLGKPASVTVEFSTRALLNQFWEVGVPFVTGALSMGLLLSILGYFLVQTLWTWSTARRWRSRKKRRASAVPNTQKESAGEPSVVDGQHLPR